MNQFQSVPEAELETIDGGILPVLIPIAIGGLVVAYCAWKLAHMDQ